VLRFSHLLALYEALAKTKPPRGDLEKWKKGTSAIVESARATVKGEDKAGEKLAKAIDCKGPAQQ